MQQHRTAHTSDSNGDASNAPGPARIEPDDRRVTVTFNGEVVADSTSSQRVLEKGHAPVFYIPPEDVRIEYLRARLEQTWCEHKGDAHYYDIAVGDRVAERAAWTYPEPKEAFRAIQHWIAFYPGKVDACTVDGEVVRVPDGADPAGWVVSSDRTGSARDASGTQKT